MIHTPLDEETLHIIILIEMVQLFQLKGFL